MNLTAGEISSNNQNALTVYQAEGASYGAPSTGGNLNLVTPLLDGAAGSVMSYTAGGAITAAPAAGTAASTTTTAALGAEIDLTGASVTINNAIVLPSGKLSITANGNITLQSGARLDLAGRAIALNDQTEYSWGGDVSLQSTNGNIVQAAGSIIDVSAVNNNAGTITAQAVGAGAGQVALNGTLTGGATGSYNGGSITVDAQTLASGTAAGLSTDFAALNTNLNNGGFSYARSFDLKQGDLTIGNELQAHNVNVSVDNGSITVNGIINASGATPGSISLAAMDNLTLSGTGVLDAHGTVLQADSYGNPIDAENRATVSLTATAGTLTLTSGSTINVSSPDPTRQGDVELNVPRTGETSGNANISAAGTVNIKGAGTIGMRP